MAILDLIRYEEHLSGTKIGCREGDCGACTVLVGELRNGELKYQSMTSCLMSLGNAQGKHIVTIEGINPATPLQNPPPLNPVQQAMADAGATQCGFCTPGFVMSLAGFCLSDKEPSYANAIAAIDGNICRCTGYKSIERAAIKIADIMEERNDEDPVDFVARQRLLPSYFSNIKSRLLLLKTDGLEGSGSAMASSDPELPVLLGGGTDLYVQKHDEMTHAAIRFVFDEEQMKGIRAEGNKCVIGASVTVTDLKESALINEIFPDFNRYAKLISSTPIRNMATVAGNFINASPIGDLTIFFLALDTQLVLSDGETKRELPLRKLYKGYKTLDKNPGEYIEHIWFTVPERNCLFHFEKVSKRMHLDIATVNSAISITMDNELIDHVSISAGGVGPTPIYLQKTSAYLKGKTLTETTIMDAIEMAQSEITPISDARGTKEYKRLLLGQLIKAHFITLFPNLEINRLIAV